MAANNKQIFRFGDVELDIAQNCLKRGKLETRLRAQTRQVLVYLLERPEQVVTHDELNDAVWNGAAVTKGSQEKCIEEIRRALGDNCRSPRFIKTEPKIGYRFIGPVEEIWRLEPSLVRMEEETSVEFEYEEETAEQALPPAAPVPALPASGNARRFTLKLALTVALAVVLSTVALLALSQSSWRAKPAADEIALPQVPGKRPLVVMRFENQSGSPDLNWLREGLPDMLITDLSRSTKLTVLGRQQVRLLLDRAGHPADAAINFSDALDVARKSRAEVLILGSFAQIDGKVRLNVQLHDARTGQLLAAESAIADQPAEILTQVDLLSLKLARHLDPAPLPAQHLQTGLADVMTNNLEAYRFYSLAVEKAQGLENKEAIALLEQAVALDPQFAMAYARIGYAYAVTWALADKAKPYLEKAFRLSDRLTERDRLYINAWYSIANLDYDNAISLFRRIVAQYPYEVEAYERLSLLLQSVEQFDEAVAVARQGLVIDPESKKLYNQLGGLYLNLGQRDEAIAMYERYVELAPEEANAYDSLGLGYHWSGRYEQAEAAYQTALQKKPDFEVAVVHLANLRFHQGRYRDALRLFQRYIEIAPSEIERGRGYGCMAWVYLKMGELEQARSLTQKEMRFQNYAVSNALHVADARGDTATSKKLQQQLFAKWPYTHRGARPPFRSDSYMRGYLALQSGRGAEAVEHFREALRHPPLIWNIESIEDCLADAYLKLGMFDEAIAEYERILRINPNFPLAHYHLAQAYERKGQMNRALTFYERFLQVWKDADADLSEIKTARGKLISLSEAGSS